MCSASHLQRKPGHGGWSMVIIIDHLDDDDGGGGGGGGGDDDDDDGAVEVVGLARQAKRISGLCLL